MTKQTYGCSKCGYTVFVADKKELEKAQKQHNITGCDGTLERAKGDCMKVAYDLCKAKPSLLFCYAQCPANIEGQTYLHVWCETQGYFINIDGKIKVRTKISSEDSNKKILDFVIDYSNNQKIVLEKEKYYKLRKIKESDVTKLSSKNLNKKITRSLRKGKGGFHWIK